MLRSFKTGPNNPLKAVKQVAYRPQSYSSVATDAPPVTQTNREQFYTISGLLFKLTSIGAETSMKRFWKSAYVNTGEGEFSCNSQSPCLCLSSSQGYLEVTLDGRPLKTPSGNKLRLPPQKKILATLIANEWDIQETILKPHALPLVRFSSCATTFHNLIVRRPPLPREPSTDLGLWKSEGR